MEAAGDGVELGSQSHPAAPEERPHGMVTNAVMAAAAHGQAAHAAATAGALHSHGESVREAVHESELAVGHTEHEAAGGSLSLPSSLGEEGLPRPSLEALYLHDQAAHLAAAAAALHSAGEPVLAAAHDAELAGNQPVRHPSRDMDTLPPPSLPPGGDYKAVLDPSLACMAEQEHRERSEAAAAEPAGPSATEPIQAITLVQGSESETQPLLLHTSSGATTSTSAVPGWVAETGGMVGAGTVSLQEVVSEPLDVVAAYDQAARAAATAAALHRLGQPIRVAANEAELALDAPGAVDFDSACVSIAGPGAEDPRQVPWDPTDVVAAPSHGPPPEILPELPAPLVPHSATVMMQALMTPPQALSGAQRSTTRSAAAQEAKGRALGGAGHGVASDQQGQHQLTSGAGAKGSAAAPVDAAIASVGLETIIADNMFGGLTAVDVAAGDDRGWVPPETNFRTAEAIENAAITGSALEDEAVIEGGGGGIAAVSSDLSLAEPVPPAVALGGTGLGAHSGGTALTRTIMGGSRPHAPPATLPSPRMDAPKLRSCGGTAGDGSGTPELGPVLTSANPSMTDEAPAQPPAGIPRWLEGGTPHGATNGGLSVRPRARSAGARKGKGSVSSGVQDSAFAAASSHWSSGEEAPASGAAMSATGSEAGGISGGEGGPPRRGLRRIPTPVPRRMSASSLGSIHSPASAHSAEGSPFASARSTDESLDELEAVTEEGSASMRSDRHLAGARGSGSEHSEASGRGGEDRDDDDNMGGGSGGGSGPDGRIRSFASRNSTSELLPEPTVASNIPEPSSAIRAALRFAFCPPTPAPSATEPDLARAIPAQHLQHLQQVAARLGGMGSRGTPSGAATPAGGRLSAATSAGIGTNTGGGVPISILAGASASQASAGDGVPITGAPSSGALEQSPLEEQVPLGSQQEEPGAGTLSTGVPMSLAQQQVVQQISEQAVLHDFVGRAAAVAGSLVHVGQSIPRAANLAEAIMDPADVIDFTDARTNLAVPSSVLDRVTSSARSDHSSAAASAALSPAPSPAVPAGTGAPPSAGTGSTAARTGATAGGDGVVRTSTMEPEGGRSYGYQCHGSNNFAMVGGQLAEPPAGSVEHARAYSGPGVKPVEVQEPVAMLLASVSREAADQAGLPPPSPGVLAAASGASVRGPVLPNV